jgi:hypothetical protein
MEPDTFTKKMKYGPHLLAPTGMLCTSFFRTHTHTHTHKHTHTHTHTHTHARTRRLGLERAWGPSHCVRQVPLRPQLHHHPRLHCYTIVTLLLHCCYTVTLLSHCCYTVVTLLLHCCYTVVTLLLHCCYTVR